jgi:hypothetical protein
MGEAKKRELAVREQVVEVLGLETAKGQLKVRWDENGQATALGQMAFFIEFLTATGLFDQWVGECPLNYKSPNGSLRVTSWGHGCCRYCLVIGVMRTSAQCGPME